MKNKTSKILSIVIVVLLIIIGYFVVTKQNSVRIGAVGGQLIEDNIPYFRNNGGMITNLPVVIGSSGTATSNLSSGNCFLDPYAATIVASSTVAVDCQGTLNVDALNAAGTAGAALTGVGINDNVQISLSTTTSQGATGGRSIWIVGASASSTAGHIELRIFNGTGTTFTWPTTSGTASGTASYISTR